MATGVDGLNGTLYVVATPIGNLEDMTLRALRVLRDVPLIAAEDTRRTRILLQHYDISTPLVSYREHNRRAATPALIHHLRTQSLALVSDAGMPAVADPGADLVTQVLDHGGRVDVVPGANAALMALVLSGLPPAPFTFVGFLSRQRGDRRRQLEALLDRPESLVFYEAPHRLLQSLADMIAILGDRPAAACRELTKVHEEVRRGSLRAVRDYFVAHPPRGEFTLVVGGSPPGTEPTPSVPDDELDAALRLAMREGADMRAAIADLGRRGGRTRRSVYARWQTLRRMSGDDAAGE